MKFHCPLVRITDQARKASLNMQRAIHQLRRSIVACQSCPLQQNCTQRAAFNAEMDALIAEINEEWQSSDELDELRPRFARSSERKYPSHGRG